MTDAVAPAGAKEMLRAEMDRQGVADNDLRAGIMALCGGESELRPRTEDSYRGTSNLRIREVFGSRVVYMLDTELNALKSDDEAFFNHVYGGEWGAHKLGNIERGDGYRFRGRGFLQLTGRDNYARYARLTGYDLVGNPELANEPAAAAAIAVAYMRDRYKGGGWDAMKRAVGNSFGTVDERKNALYRQYSANGEFDYRPDVRQDAQGASPAPVTAPFAIAGPVRIGDRSERARELQRRLIAAGFDVGPAGADGWYGDDTDEAFWAWVWTALAVAGQPRA